ncbi:MAG TPA: 2-C-methyl-D-erythritol 4-phosphate cytidylyltransferase [Gaiellaceae bacterium]|nr:2-C-methyl-D-erythritol 4-phosphate cytidylyltransferase [Gaiellaceae bacterium]
MSSRGGSGVWAVLAAAGRGERFGADRPKAFANLAGRPLLAESLERLEASDWVEAVVVVSPPEWEEPSILLAEELGAGKVNAVVTGGETRTGSVSAGVAEVPETAAVVVVHDAARPLLPEDVLERVVTALGEGWEGAVPALPLADTVKRAEGEAVVETVDRTGLYAVQTPQAFLADALRRALAGAGEATDCAGLVEISGGRVRLVEGDRRLVKVTGPADLDLVETLLRAES